MEDRDLLDELRLALRYEPETGLFKWQIKTRGYGGTKLPGDEAGTKKDGYIQIGFTHSDGKRRLYRAHRLAHWFMTGKRPPPEMDHEDHARANNKWENIRPATRSQNLMNGGPRLRPNNKSGHRGVSFRKDTKKWHARIVKDKVTHLLGDFDTKEEAIAARVKAEPEHFGEFVPRKRKKAA